MGEPYGRMNRYAAEIERLTVQEGERTGTTVLHTPGRRCSCLRPDGQTAIGCRVCDGFGWYWRDAEERRVRAILSDAQVERQLTALGIVQRGDLAIVFIRRNPRANAFDRVRLNHDASYLRTFDIPEESEIVVRGGDTPDRLQHRVAAVSSVSMSDPLTGGVALYAEGADYAVAPGTNLVTWLPGRGPARGQRYAIGYLGDFDWTVTQPPIPRAAGAVGIQGRMVLKRRVRDAREPQRLADDPYPGGIL